MPSPKDLNAPLHLHRGRNRTRHNGKYIVTAHMLEQALGLPTDLQITHAKWKNDRTLLELTLQPISDEASVHMHEIPEGMEIPDVSGEITFFINQHADDIRAGIPWSFETDHAGRAEEIRAYWRETRKKDE